MTQPERPPGGHERPGSVRGDPGGRKRLQCPPVRSHDGVKIMTKLLVRKAVQTVPEKLGVVERGNEQQHTSHTPSNYRNTTFDDFSGKVGDDAKQSEYLDDPDLPEEWDA